MRGRSERFRRVVPSLSVAFLALSFAFPTLAEPDQAAKEAALEAGFNDLVTSSFGNVDSSGGTSAETQADWSMAAGATSKLAVHGFLTQAYARSNFVDIPTELGFTGPTQDEITLGIPENGTFTYNFLALQFRYAMSEKNTMVIQLASRNLGVSAAGQFEDEIELDWAFYERRLTDNTALRVGRVQIPFGIYNEIRDVGPILPFYQPPYGYYGVGFFTSETIDGALIEHTFFPESDWALEASLYGGEFETLEFLGNAPEDSRFARAEDAWGFQLWLNTPAPDLRLGAGLTTKHASGGVFNPGRKSDSVPIWFQSLDATFGRVSVRAENRMTSTTLDIGFPTPLELDFNAWYVQLGVRATDQLEFWGQYGVRETIADNDLFLSKDDASDYKDLGISLKYSFSASVVLKAEYHEVEEEEALTLPVFDPTSPIFVRFDFQDFVLDNGDYSIVSLSVSF